MTASRIALSLAEMFAGGCVCAIAATARRAVITSAAVPHNTFNTLDSFKLGNGRSGQFYSLPKLEKAGLGKISRLPVSLRIVLESVLRNVDGKQISEDDVRTLAAWQPNA